MNIIKKIRVKLADYNAKYSLEDLKKVGDSFVPVENEIKVYYKDLEKQKNQILTQIKMLDEQINEYREIGAKDTMSWLQGYKEILNDQLKEIDNSEVRLREDK